MLVDHVIVLVDWGSYCCLSKFRTVDERDNPFVQHCFARRTLDLTEAFAKHSSRQKDFALKLSLFVNALCTFPTTQGSALAAIGSGSAFIEDSVIVKGSTNQGFAALHVSGCKVTLKRTVFSENTKDILIADDDVATFVDCDATERVNFCNGKQGIEEFRGGAGTVTNTNCLVTGDVNFNAPECA